MPKTTHDLRLKTSIQTFDAFVRCTLMGNQPWSQFQNGIRERSIEKPTAQKSISELSGTSDTNWKVVYQLPQRVTNETSLRVFQYKILNNTLYLNNQLHKFGFVESPLCSLCNREPESNLHLFCNCQETQKLWKSVQHWCKNLISLPHLTCSFRKACPFRKAGFFKFGICSQKPLYTAVQKVCV